MKINKILMFLIFIITLMSFNLENVYSAGFVCTGIANNGDTCEIRTYKYSSDGDTVEGLVIKLGVYHIKRTDSNNPNKEMIKSFDNCGYNNNKEYCSNSPARFQTGHIDSDIPAVDVDSDDNLFPIAICAFPFENSKPLNKIMDDSNIRDYIYFDEKEVESAINKGKCIRKNVYYSDDYANEKLNSCKRQKKIYTFISENDMTDANILANYYQTGPSGLCNLKINKNGKETSYNDKDMLVPCSGKNYRVSCSKKSDANYSCDLLVCEEAGLDSVGKQCELTNLADHNDKIVLSYTFNPDNSVGSHFNSLKKDGVNVKDSIIINGEEYAKSKTCPTYIYHFKISESENKYVIFDDEEKRDIYVNDHKDYKVLKQYKFKNSTDSDILTEEELEKEQIGGGGQDFEIDWGNQSDVTCDGILGEELLDFINKIFTWIRIVAPIFVIIMGSVEFAGAVLQDDKDAMKKASGRFIKRLIIAIALFFIPILIEFLLNIFNEFSRHSATICGIGGGE